jgi:S1-C subfamily serine protease
MNTGPGRCLGPVCFFVLVLVAPLASAETVQETLLRVKPAAAFVVSEVSAEVTVDCEGQRVTGRAPALRETGTGWFVHPAGWVITNAHVIASSQEASPAVDRLLRDNAVKASCLRLILARRGLVPGSRPDFEDEIARELTARVVPTARVRVDRVVAVILPNGRRLPATVAKYSPPPSGAAMSGRDLALLKLEADNLPTLRLAEGGAVKIGDAVHVIGFPSVVTTHELLSATQLEASVTRGAISGFKEDVSGQPVIQTDAAATGGDSGGPVVNDRGEVVGVMTSVSRAADEGGIVQGFNFIIPASTVRDFLRDTGTPLGDSGAFSRAWAAGLAAFFAGDYAGARPHLTDANRLLPDVPDVRRITVENEERIKNPPPRPFPWRPAGAVLVLVGALGCVLSWTDWVKRNRFRVRPRDVARLLDTEGEAGAVLLDVRDSDTYRRSPVRIPRALHVPAERLAAGETTIPVETNRPVVAYCT